MENDTADRFGNKIQLQQQMKESESVGGKLKIYNFYVKMKKKTFEMN